MGLHTQSVHYGERQSALHNFDSALLEKSVGNAFEGKTFALAFISGLAFFAHAKGHLRRYASVAGVPSQAWTISPVDASEDDIRCRVAFAEHLGRLGSLCATGLFDCGQESKIVCLVARLPVGC